MNYNAIIFIGPQGSGKGTQAQILAQKLGAAFIEMGALFREMAQQDTELGRYIKKTIDQGVLLTDQDVEKVLREKLPSVPVGQTIVFDGVPRRMGQAEFLMNLLKEAGRQHIATLYITIPREETLRRLSLRRTCEACKTPAIASGDPQQVCAKCGGRLIQRKDDTPEAINTRLDMYENDTLPVIDFLKNKTQLFEIDGTPSIEKVTEEINKALGV